MHFRFLQFCKNIDAKNQIKFTYLSGVLMLWVNFISYWKEWILLAKAHCSINRCSICMQMQNNLVNDVLFVSLSIRNKKKNIFVGLHFFLLRRSHSWCEKKEETEKKWKVFIAFSVAKVNYYFKHLNSRKIFPSIYVLFVYTL